MRAIVNRECLKHVRTFINQIGVDCLAPSIFSNCQFLDKHFTNTTEERNHFNLQVTIVAVGKENKCFNRRQFASEVLRTNMESLPSS